MARKLVVVILLAAVAWSAYWWVGSTAKDTALRAWLDQQQQAGWVAEYADLKVRGFPNRFDTRIKNLELADPQSGWAWSAPEFQILALSYQPNHIIAVWPQNQTVSSPFERVRVEADEMRASVKFEANTALALDHTILIVDNLKLASTADWVSSMKRATFTTEQTPERDFTYDIGFQAEAVEPAKILKIVIDPDDILPDTFEVLRVRTTAAFDAPWDRLAVEGRKPELTTLEVHDITATWGELDFQAKGTLEIDSIGYPVGKIAVRAKNWKGMLEVAVNSGMLPRDFAGTVEGLLEIVANLSGNSKTIDAPLIFKDGYMKLGPLPLGRAPRFWMN
ncbi:MAG: DUF2125 domain-containing protein [Rhodobacteraceae bacterium]|nr:DUF2125 domain-containing protein [Paracoccaceae bacterium]